MIRILLHNDVEFIRINIAIHYWKYIAFVLFLYSWIIIQIHWLSVHLKKIIQLIWLHFRFYELKLLKEKFSNNFIEKQCIKILQFILNIIEFLLNPKIFFSSIVIRAIIKEENHFRGKNIFPFLFPKVFLGGATKQLWCFNGANGFLT